MCVPPALLSVLSFRGLSVFRIAAAERSHFVRTTVSLFDFLRPVQECHAGRGSDEIPAPDGKGLLRAETIEADVVLVNDLVAR